MADHDRLRNAVRLANAHIRSFAATQESKPDDEWEFFCECGCMALVSMTIAKYDAAYGVWLDRHQPSRALERV